MALSIVTRRPSGSTAMAPARTSAHGARQQSMLDGADPIVERRDVVAGHDGHRLLGHDRATVERLVDEVDGAAGHGHAVGQGVQHGMGPGERREQRRVRVEDPTREGGEHLGSDDPHVAGQDDDVRMGGAERVRERRVVTARDERRFEALFDGPLEPRTRPVREHERDRPAHRTARCRGGQRPKVGSGARHADRDPPGSPHATVSSAPST